MSESGIKEQTKADIAFYKGYQNHRFNYHKQLFLHLFIAVAFIIFIPIDASVLDTGDDIIPAEAVALGAAIISIVINVYIHYVRFGRPGVLGYCELAKLTLHSTEQPLVSLQNQEVCTSQTVLDAASGVLIEGLPQKTINVYANMAFYHIDQVNDYKYNLNCWERIQYFCGVSAMVIVIVLMAKSDHMNTAEIVILVCYLVIESISKWKIIVVLIIVLVSPLILIVFCFWMCCCAPAGGVNSVDLQPVAATTEHVVKSDGECAICLMSINPKQNVYQLPCSDKHIFHTGCLDKWTRVKVTCPICRKQMPMKVVAGQAQVPID